MNRFRKIFISVMLTFILATGCGAANAAPTQQATTQEQAEQATTQEQAEQAPTQEQAEQATTQEQAEQATTQEQVEQATEATKAEYNEEERRVYFPDGLYMIWDHDRPPTDEELEELLKFWREHTEK